MTIKKSVRLTHGKQDIDAEIEIFFAFDEEDGEHYIDNFKVLGMIDESLEEVVLNHEIEEKIWDWIEEKTPRLLREMKAEYL